MADNRIRFSNNFVLKDNKVGINTTDPQALLDVGGELRVSGASTFAGIITTSTDVYVGGDLYVQDDLIFDNFSTNSFDIINNATIGGNLGIGTTNPQEKLDIDGNALVDGNIIIGSTIGAASTEKMEISAVSRDNGLLEIANYGGNQLFSVSNNQSESAFSVYRYANYDNLSITSFKNRNLFSVSPLGIVTTYGALRVGTSITTANSSVYNELYGRLNVRAPFSTTTEYVSIVPKFSDKGALSFEAPVGTALTDRGTQIFSISNNVDSSIFRVNDLNRQPIFEASASGNAGIGTTNPQKKLEILGDVRLGAVGSTLASKIDLNSYVDFKCVSGTGINTIANGLGFDSPAGITTDGVTFFPASLFGIVNDPTGNIFSVGGYRYFSGSSFPVIDVTQSGMLGIGITNPQADFHINSQTYISANVGIGNSLPYVALDVATEAQFRNRVGLSQTGNPDGTSVIDIQSYTPGITTFFNDSAVVITSNRINDGRNSSQLYTIEDNDNTVFRVNVVGFGLTTSTSPTTPIYQALDIDSNHNVNIFDTTYTDVVKQISGFSTTNPVVGDSDLFRVDAFSSPFIGSFPTVSKALRIDKFGLIEVNRNINQISGIATVGLGSTSSPSLNSTMSFELTNNTTLTVRVKGTDGVVRTGIITLS